MIKALISDSGFRLRVSYALLCGICFLQLLFLAVFIFFTTDLIQQRFEAADFLRQAEVIPLPATLILGGTLLLYPMLLGVMQLRGHVREKPWSALAFLLLESVICMALLRLTSFAGNLACGSQYADADQRSEKPRHRPDHLGHPLFVHQ